MAILDEIMEIEPCPVIMLSSLMRDGAPIAAEAMDRGAAACFNKAMIVREAKRFVSLIREVGRGLAPDIAQDQVAIAA
jgi:two-component system chemotaxis response regulator CheB